MKELKKLKKFRNKSDRASNSFEEEDSVGDSLGTPSNSKPLGKLFSSNKDKSLVKDRSLIFFEADRPAEAIS